MELPRLALVVCLLLLVAAPSRAERVDLAPFLRTGGFVDAKISPQGTYIAVTVARGDRTALAVIRRADLKTTATFSLGENSHIGRFDWVTDDRLLVGMAEKFGLLETPVDTGEIYGVNADGSRAKILVGLRAFGEEGSSGALAGEQFNSRAFAAYLLDTLPTEPRHVLIENWPFGLLPMTRVQRMDIHTGKRRTVAEAPIPRASFATDHGGRVRFAVGAAADNVSKLYHRAPDGGDWTLVNDQSATGVREFPRGFAADNQVAYLEAERAQGPNALIAFDTRTGARRQVLRDAQTDPWVILRAPGAVGAPIGAVFTGASVRVAFFDEESETARVFRRLEKGFGGLPAYIVSSTDDGALALVLSWSGGNPGDFFLFDTQALRAERLLSRQEWLDPVAAAEVKPVRIAARDGLQLDGFLTRARGADGKQPLVVMPHGGPFGEFDALGHDADAQLLAKAGYAVLQVNFRGSGNRGRAFREAGARQWGRAMQDDLTDATRWAIEQSIADPERICLVGASYGAYAAMVGLAREPDLYRCGVGYVGVYDLPMMTRDRVRLGKATANWIAEWIGEGQALVDASATTLATKIVDPVLLVAGGRDLIAPPAHTEAMAAALKTPAPRSRRSMRPTKATASTPRRIAAST